MAILEFPFEIDGCRRRPPRGRGFIYIRQHDGWSINMRQLKALEAFAFLFGVIFSSVLRLFGTQSEAAFFFSGVELVGC